MTSLWKRWADLLDHREAATALAVCRILAAGTVFLHLTTMWISGTAMGVWVSVNFGGLRETDLTWLEPFGGATPRNVGIVLALGIVYSALMTVGAYTRVTTPATWLCFRLLTGLNDHSGGSSDDVLVNALFVLSFSGCGGALFTDTDTGLISACLFDTNAALTGGGICNKKSAARGKLHVPWKSSHSPQPPSRFRRRRRHLQRSSRLSHRAELHLFQQHRRRRFRRKHPRAGQSRRGPSDRKFSF